MTREELSYWKSKKTELTERICLKHKEILVLICYLTYYNDNKGRANPMIPGEN